MKVKMAVEKSSTARLSVEWLNGLTVGGWVRLNGEEEWTS